MSNRRTLDEMIADTREELRQKENRVKVLLQRQKEENRKATNKRLFERGKMVERLIDGAETLSNEEIEAILTAALNPPAPEVPPSIIMRIFRFCRR